MASYTTTVQAFSKLIEPTALVAEVEKIGLPYDPYKTTVEGLAAYGDAHLDFLYHKIGHFIPYDPFLDECLTVEKICPDAPKPIYPAFTNAFATSEQAREHRRRTRTDDPNRCPKKAGDIDRVRKFGRQYWVRRLYNAMIDVSNITDMPGSIHRQRFKDKHIGGWDPLDLEAAAHHIFDACLRVHERGWCRPVILHKNVKRGRGQDTARGSIERRLFQICVVLKQSKAAVDDALRGGVTLALLADNPTARMLTKASNNNGNANRGNRLKLAEKAKEGYMLCKVTKEVVKIPRRMKAEYLRREKAGMALVQVGDPKPEPEDEEEEVDGEEKEVGESQKPGQLVEWVAR